jgi:hypothetical protein
MADIKLTVALPEKQPYEGKATMKQKQKLWEMGYQDQTVIDSLGKRQASFLIDSIKGAENRAGAKAIGSIAAILVIAAIVCCHAGGVWWCAGIPLWLFGGILGLTSLSTLLKS